MDMSITFIHNYFTKKNITIVSNFYRSLLIHHYHSDVTIETPSINLSIIESTWKKFANLTIDRHRYVEQMAANLLTWVQNLVKFVF